VGRQPVKVVRWGLKSGLGPSLYPVGDSIGPDLPHCLEIGDSATWTIDLQTAQTFIQTTNAAFGKSLAKSDRNLTLVGRIGAEVNRLSRTNVVAIVELGDGRTKLSKGTLQ
jgi:hypothetical protein